MLLWHCTGQHVDRTLVARQITIDTSPVGVGLAGFGARLPGDRSLLVVLDLRVASLRQTARTRVRVSVPTNSRSADAVGSACPARDRRHRRGNQRQRGGPYDQSHGRNGRTMDPTVYFTPSCSQRCFTSSCSQRTADVGRAPSDATIAIPRATVLIDGMRGVTHHRCDPPVTRYGTTSAATDAHQVPRVDLGAL